MNNHQLELRLQKLIEARDQLLIEIQKKGVSVQDHTKLSLIPYKIDEMMTDGILVWTKTENHKPIEVEIRSMDSESFGMTTLMGLTEDQAYYTLKKVRVKPIFHEYGALQGLKIHCANLEEIEFSKIPLDMAYALNHVINISGCSKLKRFDELFIGMKAAYEQLGYSESIPCQCFKDCESLYYYGPLYLYGLDSSSISGYDQSIVGANFENCKNLFITKLIFWGYGTSIPSYAFHNCVGLCATEIELIGNAASATEQWIEANAFQGCTNLQLKKIPAAYCNIYEYAFDGCNNMTLENGLSENIWRIGAYAFRNCTKLKIRKIPESVQSMGDYVFENCGMETFTTARNYTYMQRGMLKNCKKLKIFALKKGCQDKSYNFSEETCMGCTALEIVDFNPDNVTERKGIYVYGKSFKDCTSLTTVRMSSGIEYAYFGDQCFENTAISDVSFMNASTYFGYRAFADCLNLIHLNYANTSSESAVTIGTNIVAGCDNLETVDMSGYNFNIYAGAFEDCSSITTITIRVTGSENLTIDEEAFRGLDGITIRFTCPKSQIENNENEPWGSTNCTFVYEYEDE